MDLVNQLIETLEINNRINLFLIGKMEEKWLTNELPTKGRNAREQFAHIHNVRLMWLKEAAPELLIGLSKIEKENVISKKILKTELSMSASAMRKMFEKAIKEGKIKGFKPHPAAFLGYIISHESHHRSQIILCLKSNGHLTSKSLGFALWQWGTR